jgi:hypothetical protein
VTHPSDVIIAPAPILAYTGAHLLVFLILGAAMAAYLIWVSPPLRRELCEPEYRDP